MRSILLLVHLAGVIVWVGGMFFAHFCLRPEAAAQLQPPQRLPLLAGVLGRFFSSVAVAVGAILISGFGLILSVGMAHAPWPWHLMLTSGLVMSGIFIYIYGVLFQRLRAGVAIQDWPTAGAEMNRIRPLVAFNLLLGTLTVAVAILGPMFA